ncbi:hypothetical protein DFH06DRAFT_1337586 [Mycena polygramma]|nr:hypothetical protein DFH06DRAFT_1337586 [Mycena polygramma]
MPEKGVLKLLEREINWEKSDSIGEFVAHPPCCARVNGNRQTFTVHVSSPTDTKFVPLVRYQAAPSKKKKNKKNKSPELPEFYCNGCHCASSDEGTKPFKGSKSEAAMEDEVDLEMPEKADVEDEVDLHCNSPTLTPTCSSGDNSEADMQSDTGAADMVSDTPPPKPPASAADYVNSLKITGRIRAKARGKELVVAICNAEEGRNFVFRVGYYLEGHCFWMPTEWYRRIVSEPPIHRGEKSYAYPIPPEYIDGPSGARMISIQAAFIKPKYTLVFVDHNVMIRLHLMQMPSAFTFQDLEPGSPFWQVLWSRTHGPVYSQEPAATLAALRAWRAHILSKPKDLTPIVASMKNHQTVFNGSGAQEATDQLLEALIHPQMPALYVCQHDATFNRLHKVFIEYDASRMQLATSDAHLPFVSGARPLRMNQSGHIKYLRHISSYRRNLVRLDADRLQQAHALGLFVPNAVIHPDGHARVPPGIAPQVPSIPTTLRADRRQKSIEAVNFAITIGEGKGHVVSYSPFSAQPGPTWWKATREMVITDVKAEVNDTTLGLYSFRIFVDCVWSTQKIPDESILRGRRPLQTVGQSNRKRPRAEDIGKTAAPKKRRVSMVEVENVDPSEGRVTRSQSKKQSL